MRIAGVQKLTLLDFPGKTAATVFTLGCNLRCPFCHNSELVVGTAEHDSAREGASQTSAPESPAPRTDTPEDVLAFLRKRRGLLDGVCVSGGEPLLQAGLADFLKEARELGYQVKLDTNGTLPDQLAALLDAGLLDRVALDVKNAPKRYAETTGCECLDLDAVRESMRRLLAQDPVDGADCELRTTVVRELHGEEDLLALARWIADESSRCGHPITAERPAWFIQNFKDSRTVLAGEGVLHPWSEKDLKALLPRLREILPGTRLRGTE